MRARRANAARREGIERVGDVESNPIEETASEVNEGMEDKADASAGAAILGPMKVLRPLHTDAIKALQSRQRRLERLVAVSMPEVHYVGQLVSGKNLVLDSSEGACCRWKIDYGKAWEHLGGDVFGQTQISYAQDGIVPEFTTSSVIFNHPLDLHFAAAGLQGWGAPRITLQSYRMDWHGRRLLTGYGFAHLPTTPGPHRLEISLWRPVGSSEQELEAYLLGNTPALTSHEPIYESAWRDRCRLITVSAGKILIEVFVTTRFFQNQGVDTQS